MAPQPTSHGATLPRGEDIGRVPVRRRVTTIMSRRVLPGTSTISVPLQAIGARATTAMNWVNGISSRSTPSSRMGRRPRKYGGCGQTSQRAESVAYWPISITPGFSLRPRRHREAASTTTSGRSGTCSTRPERRLCSTATSIITNGSRPRPPTGCSISPQVSENSWWAPGAPTSALRPAYERTVRSGTETPLVS